MLIEELLKIEDEANLWDYSIDGVRLWPLIRSNVYKIAIGASKDYCQAHATDKRSSMLRPDFLRNIFTSALFFNSDRKCFDSLFFTTARYQRIQSATAVYHDEFYTPYFSLFSNPLIFENSYQNTVHRPRDMEKNTLLGDYLILAATIRSLRSGFNNTNKDTIEKFLKVICDLFSLSPQYNTLKEKLNRRVRSAPYLDQYIDQIVPRLDGDVAFVHGASYLGDNGQITKQLKYHGIKTIELQHGFVGPDHFAYNYSLGNSHSIAQGYLPDYYLTFGNYWNEQVQTPSDKIAVGNPSLNAAKDTYGKIFTSVPRSILVVSQGTITPTMVRIAKFLSKTLPMHTIYFKLHPGEVPFTGRYEELERYDNVYVKKYDNIYELIALSEIIVGYNSTTLFEAVAFPGKRIFILKNDVIPDSLGYKFSNCEELRDAILDDESGHSSTEPSYFWEPKWNTNISLFISSIFSTTESLGIQYR